MFSHGAIPLCTLFSQPKMQSLRYSIFRTCLFVEHVLFLKLSA